MRMPRLFIVLLGLLTLALSLPAQAQSADAALRVVTRPIQGVTAQTPLPEPVSLALADGDARDLVENLFVGLFRYDAATRSAVPLLAREWTVGEDGLVWTFHLRDDIPWVAYNRERGEITVLRPVSAEDVVAALRRACHPLRPSPQSPAIYVIQGCYTAAHANPLLVTDQRVAAWVGVEAPDSTTLVIRLAYPVAYLPSLLTQPEFRPIPREFVDFTPAWPMMASSGPYVLIGWSPGEGLTLVRNPHWPDPLPGNIAQVTLTYGAEEEDRVAAFRQGQADFARLGGGGPALFAARPEAVQVRRGLGVTLLGFSTERAFVRELGVRRALAWALDREALLAALPGAAALPVATLTPPGVIAGPPADIGVGFEPEAARAALAGAGFANCGGVPEIIELAVPRGQEPLAEQIVAGWSAVLGCAPNLFAVRAISPERLVDIGRSLIDAENTTRPHLWLVPWRMTYLDAHGGAADAFHCRFGYFVSGLPCGPLDALLDWAGATASGPERADIYARIEARFFGPAGLYPAVPLWAEGEYVGVAAGLSGVGDFGPAWWGDWRKAP